MPSEDTVMSGRKAVDNYRIEHIKLHLVGLTPEGHTPLLEKMMNDLSKIGFSSLQEFFDYSARFELDLAGIPYTIDDIATSGILDELCRDKIMGAWE